MEALPSSREALRSEAPQVSTSPALLGAVRTGGVTSSCHPLVCSPAKQGDWAERPFVCWVEMVTTFLLPSPYLALAIISLTNASSLSNYLRRSDKGVMRLIIKVRDAVLTSETEM